MLPAKTWRWLQRLGRRLTANSRQPKRFPLGPTGPPQAAPSPSLQHAQGSAHERWEASNTV
eukprot:2239383-Alexandrium_andersonii.AAC.1